MSELDLAAIKERVDDMMAAKEWLATVSESRDSGFQAQLVAEDHYKKAKKQVKSEACDDIPGLIAEVERLRAENAGLIQARRAIEEDFLLARAEIERLEAIVKHNLPCA